jgi:hypothetical protein
MTLAERLRAAAMMRRKSIAGRNAQPCEAASHGRSVPTRHTIEPIERSIPPLVMTNAAPMLMSEKRAVRRRRFSIFTGARNRSLIEYVTRHAAIRRRSNPRFFFMLLPVDALMQGS